MRWHNGSLVAAPEKRQGEPLAGQVGDLFFNLAANDVEAGDPSGHAALEIASGLYARAFALAVVEPVNVRTAAVTAAVRSLIARNLIRRGEDCHLVQVAGGRVNLRPVGFWHVRGGVDEETWAYHVYRYGATGSESGLVEGARVVHSRFAVHSSRPWLGVSPLQWASRTGTLAANLERRLGEETGAAVGSLIPVPDRHGDTGEEEDADPLAALKADFAAIKGRTLLVETTAAAWGEGRGAAPMSDWKPHRIGGAPPSPTVSLRSDASMAVLAACGVPPSLVADKDGTAQRESWRRFLHGSIAPLAETVSAELADKLDVPGLRFTFDRLFASDLSGRARAFQSMVGGGMDVSKAAALAGLMEAE